MGWEDLYDPMYMVHHSISADQTVVQLCERDDVLRIIIMVD
jgi:hypothetical protein